MVRHLLKLPCRYTNLNKRDNIIMTITQKSELQQVMTKLAHLKDAKRSLMAEVEDIDASVLLLREKLSEMGTGDVSGITESNKGDK